MNVLIITEVNSRRNYGGKEKFNRYLIKHLLNKGYKVIEYSLNFHTESNFNNIEYGNNYSFIVFPKKLSSSNLNWKMNQIDKQIYEYCDSNNFDIIISSLHDDLKKTKTRKNFIYVTHNSPAGLLGWNNDNIFFKFKKLIKHFLGYTNQFKNLQNLVVPDYETYKDLVKKTRKAKKIANIFVITWPHELDQEDDNAFLDYEQIKKRQNDVIWVGRIYNKQKNIRYLNSVANELEKYNIKLHVYGNGPDKKFLNSSNVVFHGWLNDKNKLNILSQYKFFVIVSNNEGSPLVLYESISCGVPVIGRKTFPNLSYLLKNNNGFLINKTANPKVFAKKINELMKISNDEYYKIAQQNITFYKQNLQINSFYEGWDKVLNKLTNT